MARVRRRSNGEAARARDDGLRVVGELGLGIAHDLTNLLAAITFRLYPLQTDPSCMRRHGENVDAIARIVDNGKRMIARLQALSSDGGRDLVRVDVQDTLAAAIEIAQSSVRLPAVERGQALRIRRSLGALPPVAGDADEMRRVFVNLLLNARDAMPDGGTVTVRGRLSSSHVVLTFEDEGTGIAPQDLPRIFDALFTTKGAHGRGMGLAIARAVMHEMGGAITARNRREGGACFELHFVPFGVRRRRRRPVAAIPELRPAARRESRA